MASKIRVEAENMVLSGAYGAAPFAVSSGTAAASLTRNQSTTGLTGTAGYVHTGAAGTYELAIAYYQEPDGGATIDVDVAGARAGRIYIYAPGADAVPGIGSLKIKTFEVSLNPGDSIALTARGSNWSHAVVDYIELTNLGDSVNTPPVAGDDVVAINQESIITLDVLANDSDADGDTLSVQTVNTTGTTGDVGFTDNAVTYDPNGRFDHLGTGETATDFFSYTVVDGQGGSDTATVTVTVQGADLPPPPKEDGTVRIEAENMDLSGAYGAAEIAIASSGSAASLPRHQSTAGLTGAVRHIHTGPAGTFELAVAYYNERDGGATIDVDVAGARVGKIYIYSSTAGTGPSDGSLAIRTFTVALNPGDEIKLTAKGSNWSHAVVDYIELTGEGTTNISPVAGDDSATTNENTPIILDVLSNDTDADGGSLSIASLDTAATKGSATNNAGTITYNPDGAFDYLGAGHTATDVLTYRLSDGQGGADTATVSVAVTGVNDAPVANDDTAATDKATAITFGNVLQNDRDVDVGDQLAVVGLDLSGTVGRVTDRGDGTFDYDPNGQFEGLRAGESAVDTFRYTVSDSHGGTDSAIVTIVVSGGEPTPSGTARIEAEDMDLSGAYGTASFSIASSGEAVSLPRHQATSGLTGVAGYTHKGAAGDYELAVAYYQERDGGSTIDVDVAGERVGKIYIYSKSAAATPSEGSLSVKTFKVALNPGDEIKLTAHGSNWSHAVVDYIELTGEKLVNQPPVALDDSGSTDENKALVIDVLANDSDPEGGSLSIKAIDLSDTQGSVWTNDGQVTYRPDGRFDYLGKGESATDTFSYWLVDDAGARDIGTVTVTINGQYDHHGVVALDETNFWSGFRLTGETAYTYAGYSVSGAGDVNGDGFMDVMVGAPGGDTYLGHAYVYFGGPQQDVREVPLSSLDGKNGIRLDGRLSNGINGFSVSGAGDINNDGYADVVTGAPARTAAITPSWTYANVYYGKAGGFLPVSQFGSIAETDGFRAYGPVRGEEAGWSAGGIGDINGDGYGDFAVGAPNAGQNGHATHGAVYVVFGKTENFVPPYNLGTLGAQDGFRIEGESYGDEIGVSVNAAGDVNGDGIDDLIIGGVGDALGENSLRGVSYVLFGSAGGFGARIKISDVNGVNGFRINGIDERDYAGHSVAAAGDINGDGIGDIIIGAPKGDSLRHRDNGEAYIVYGRADGFDAEIDPAALDGSNGFSIFGRTTDDRLGFSASAAGDFNGDGTDDIIIGAPHQDGSGLRTGKTHIIFGQRDGFPAFVSPKDLDPDEMLELRGFDDGENVGISVSGAGDVNGDGYDDVIIGAEETTIDGEYRAGAAYVVYGRDQSDVVTHQGTVAADEIDGTPGADIIIAGQGNDTVLGFGGADVIRTGAGDDIITVFDTEFQRIDAGSGQDRLNLASNAATLDLSGTSHTRLEEVEWIDLTGNGNTLIINQANVLAMAPQSNSITLSGSDIDVVHIVDSAFVVTGSTTIDGKTYHQYVDGLATLLVARSMDVTFGNVAPTAVSDDLAISENANPGLATGNVLDNDHDPDGGPLPLHVETAGTLVGQFGAMTIEADGSFEYRFDGDTEVIDALADGEQLVESFSYVLTDGAAETAGFVSFTFDGVDDAPVVGDDSMQIRSGLTLASGDVLANDRDPEGLDLFVADAGQQAGLFGTLSLAQDGTFRYEIDTEHAAYNDLGLGQSLTDSFNYSASDGTLQTNSQLSISIVKSERDVMLPSITADVGVRFDGAMPGDAAGRSVAGVGDVNGDGFDDVLIGAREADRNGLDRAGAAYVLFGRDQGFSVPVDLGGLTDGQGLEIAGISQGSRFGTASSGGGDTNNDGYADLIVSSQSAVRHYVINGAPTLGGELDLKTLDGSDGYRLVDARYASSAVSLEADINGDGVADLAVGAISYWGAPSTHEGGVYVKFGDIAEKSSTLSLAHLYGDTGFFVEGIFPFDFTGTAVFAAGDVNGDGYDELIISAPDANGLDRSEAGEAYVLFGAGGRFPSDINLAHLDGSNGFRIAGVQSDTGLTVGGGGDLNGDGYADMVISSGAIDADGESDVGATYVVFGKSGGFGRFVDLATLNGNDGFVLIGADPGDRLGLSTFVGDLNADGFDDLAMSAIGADPNGSVDAGKTYIYFGHDRDYDAKTPLDWLDPSELLVLNGGPDTRSTGSRIDAAGDFNGDGYGDVVVGAWNASPDGRTDAGQAYVVYGKDFGSDVTHQGTDAADLLTGTTNADVMVGGLGDDTLIGAGGRDAQSGGQGDDLLAISDFAFQRLVGGTGHDTVRLDGSDMILDLVSIPDSRIVDIEAVNLNGGGNDLVLNRLELVNLSVNSNSLSVTGDGTNAVIADFTGLGFTASDLGAETLYTAGIARLVVDDDIDQTGILIG